MKKAALAVARTCLEETKAALCSMESADSLAKMETAWSDFLIKANRVYTKLEQGAKGNNKSAPWFGRKQSERKKDPLLRYIKNARHADEHGLERVTARHGHGVGLGAAPGKSVAINEPIRISNTEKGSTVEFLGSGKPPSGLVVHFYPPGVRLVEVTNRGVKYQPPEDTNPTSVAKKAITCLEALVAEAEKLYAT
jgi:hypothetical protein